MKCSELVHRFEGAADGLRSPLLLAIRLYWGLQFVQTGWGKLTHIDRTAAYFGQIGIPLPALNAALAGGTEFLCGALFALGLCTRVSSVPLALTMCVAYATAERGSLAQVFSNPDAFTSATPFLFLLAVLIGAAFGPGYFSLDRALVRRQPAAAK